MIERIIECCAKNKFLTLLFIFFAVILGIWTLKKTPLDAIPDLSDVQVIIYSDWEGRSPDLVEDQITYPIVTAMLSAPKVKVVRGFSFFEASFVYIIFEDGTDIYWARSRVLEYMNEVKGKLPPGVSPTLGPDATGVGWGFEYALVDETGNHNLASLRSLQDWNLRYALKSVPGVSDVASLGGFVKQYQVNINPSTLLGYNLSINGIMEAIRAGNNDVGARVVEFSGREYMVRGRGYIRSVSDLENISVGDTPNGTPILLRDVARVQIGPDIRRGIAELDGQGEVVGGIVVIRFGENVLDVIERVKKKISEIAPSLPKGVKIITTYDRSDLILRAVDTLKEKLIEEAIIVSLVSIIFLFHFRSALVVIITLPIAILMSFIGMYYIKLSSNIMSLGGIAIAIGAMVDAAIVMVENAHKRLEHAGDHQNRTQVIIDAAKEVGKPLFFSLLIITISFLPVFTLEAQEGRLFKPLAFTKTFAMFFASILSITLAPILMVWLIRGRITPEAKNPLSRLLIWLYQPFVKAVLRFKKTTICLALIALVFTVIPFYRLGSEFMPPLYEGTLLYMPTTLPSISITEAGKLLQIQDKIIKEVPEVARVFGKAGRAETATDPAPLEMAETIIILKPEKEWRPGMTIEKLIDELDRLNRYPGVSNAWTMPIKARVDMLTTGIRTPIGIKIFGKNIETLHTIGEELERTLASVPGTRSVYAERLMNGYFLDFDIKRNEIARYGLSVMEVEEIIETAVGGKNISTTIEGRERYPINLRYARELRDDLDKLKRVLVPTVNGAQVPLAQLADIRLKMGPPVLRSEGGVLAGYVYVDVAGRDLGSYVAEAKKTVNEKMKLPGGYSLSWSGQYEYMERAKERLKYVVPLTLLIIFLLLYLNFKSVTESFIVLLSVPFALVGGIWLLYLLGYNLSVAVWVGIIALTGVAAETGVVMIVYLDEAYERRKREGSMRNLRDLYEAIHEGAVQRVRPKMMTVAAIMAGLFPIMWSTGAGADVMKRIAAPMIGGMITSTVLTLLIIPAIYMLWKGRSLSDRKRQIPLSNDEGNGREPESTSLELIEKSN